MYRKVTEFKKHGIKVTLALGGWNDSKGDKYSRLVNNPAARKRFIDHVIGFIEEHDFDGLDLDWEYPSCWQVDIRNKDKLKFISIPPRLSAKRTDIRTKMLSLLGSESSLKHSNQRVSSCLQL